MIMRKLTVILRIVCVCFALTAGLSCKKSEIQGYDIKQSAVNFWTVTNEYSLRGLSEPVHELKVEVKLIGVPASYDRPFGLVVKDSTAVQGRDFRIVEAMIPAGELSGYVKLEVNALQEGVERLSTVLTIDPGEHFRTGFPSLQRAVVTWTDSYARPPVQVWQYWYNFFCHGYSSDYHKLLLELFGDDIELPTNKKLYAEDGFIYKDPTWWYTANRRIREEVSAYDMAHPGEPMRHSADYESYRGYTVAYGEGTKPATPPTISETLVNL